MAMGPRGLTRDTESVWSPPTHTRSTADVMVRVPWPHQYTWQSIRGVLKSLLGLYPQRLWRPHMAELPVSPAMLRSAYPTRRSRLSLMVKNLR